MDKVVFLFVVCCFSAFLREGWAQQCNRQFSSPPAADCYTHEHEGCFVNFGTALGIPSDNSRLCYRTCHTGNTPGSCNATLVNNRALNVELDETDYTLRTAFSPNFFGNGLGNYRKSTICRYKMKCTGNFLLSYSFDTHELESAAQCSGSSLCVDYIKMEFPGFGPTSTEITCGNQGSSQVQLDGLQELDLEFHTNRYLQHKGFFLYVWCSLPNTQLPNPPPPSNGRRKRSRPVLVEEETCTTIPYDQRIFPDPAEEFTATFPESADMFEPIASTGDSRIQITLNELDILTYKSSVITITRGRFSKDEENDIIRDIPTLWVSNRFRPSQQFLYSAQGTFKGFGEVWVDLRQKVGFVIQKGVNPITRPTQEEATLISRFEKAMVPALRNLHAESFDVLDNQDILEAIQNGEPVPEPEKITFAVLPESDPDLDREALRYGIACNNLLRSAACAYQKLILNQDCNEPTKKPALDTSPTMISVRQPRRPQRPYYYPYQYPRTYRY